MLYGLRGMTKNRSKDELRFTFLTLFAYHETGVM